MSGRGSADAGARRQFMNEALQTILGNPEHRLSFLVDREAGTWLGRSHLDYDAPSVQAGHLTSRHSGAEERYALEDAYLNQRASWRGESLGVIEKREAIEIDGVAVEKMTARLWETQGAEGYPGLAPGTVQSAPVHTGWARDESDGPQYEPAQQLASEPDQETHVAGEEPLVAGAGGAPATDYCTEAAPSDASEQQETRWRIADDASGPDQETRFRIADDNPEREAMTEEEAGAAGAGGARSTFDGNEGAPAAESKSADGARATESGPPMTPGGESTGGGDFVGAVDSIGSVVVTGVEALGGFGTTVATGVLVGVGIGLKAIDTVGEAIVRVPDTLVQTGDAAVQSIDAAIQRIDAAIEGIDDMLESKPVAGGDDGVATSEPALDAPLPPSDLPAPPAFDRSQPDPTSMAGDPAPAMFAAPALAELYGPPPAPDPSTGYPVQETWTLSGPTEAMNWPTAAEDAQQYAGPPFDPGMDVEPGMLSDVNTSIDGGFGTASSG